MSRKRTRRRPAFQEKGCPSQSESLARYRATSVVTWHNCLGFSSAIVDVLWPSRPPAALWLKHGTIFLIRVDQNGQAKIRGLLSRASNEHQRILGRTAPICLCWAMHGRRAQHRTAPSRTVSSAQPCLPSPHPPQAGPVGGHAEAAAPSGRSIWRLPASLALANAENAHLASGAASSHRTVREVLRRGGWESRCRPRPKTAQSTGAVPHCGRAAGCASSARAS